MKSPFNPELLFFFPLQRIIHNLKYDHILLQFSSQVFPLLALLWAECGRGDIVHIGLQSSSCTIWIEQFFLPLFQLRVLNYND